MAIELENEQREMLIASIKRFFEEMMDQSIGDLKAALWLDFALKEIGPAIYNAAVSDAQAHLAEVVAELDATCYEPESGYWEQTSRSRFDPSDPAY
jgi:uncharacterized protein (DUF2164 family)